MIAMVQPLSAGNALRVFLQPPEKAVRWKVLRKTADTINAVNDPDAVVVYTGNDKSFVDTSLLANNAVVFYRPFYTANGIDWLAGISGYGTPSATYHDYTIDCLSFVRERIEAGLKVECERGNFQTQLGYIQVYTAPPSLEQNLLFPLVTVTLDEENPENRAIGELVLPDEFDSIGNDWQEAQGWIAPTQISIVGWSLNSDERLELRKALRRVLISNLAVFAGKGFDQINVQFSDIDSLGAEYNVPMYQVMAAFSCNAPVIVGNAVPANEDYTLNVEGMSCAQMGAVDQTHQDLIVTPMPEKTYCDTTIYTGIAIGGHRVLIATADGCDYANANNLDHVNKVIGISVGAFSRGDQVVFAADGEEMFEPSWNFQIGAVYLGVNGLLTQNPAGLAFMQQVATALSSNRILVKIEPPIIMVN